MLVDRPQPAQESSSTPRPGRLNSGLAVRDRTASWPTRVGGNALISVVPTEKVYLVANLKETRTGRRMSGQKVEIDIDSFLGPDRLRHLP